jgi:hypothetical protein
LNNGNKKVMLEQLYAFQMIYRIKLKLFYQKRHQKIQ